MDLNKRSPHESLLLQKIEDKLQALALGFEL
jgi:hypothetical protein